MRKISIMIIGITLIAMTGCKKDNSTSSSALDNKVLVSNIFSAGMGGVSQGNTTKSAEIMLSPLTIVVNPVDYTAIGPEGGTIHVLGDVTMTMNFDADYNFLNGSLLLGMTETINDYAFLYNGKKYTMNGAPYISLTGTFTLQSDFTFGTASSMQMGGGIRVVGPSYDQTVNINITIIINSSGSGGHVSGTIGDESINYTF
jgi:hypothetical protein